MSTELKDLHLADLYERAASAGVRGYRMLRREELIARLERKGSGIVDDEADTDELAVIEEAKPDRPRSAEAESRAGQRPTIRPTRLRKLRRAGDRRRQRSARDNSPALRLPSSLRPGARAGDVYVSAAQVRRCELRSGDEVSGPAREPKRGERHRALVHVDQVNGHEPLSVERIDFDALAPVVPERADRPR